MSDSDERLGFKAQLRRIMGASRVGAHPRELQAAADARKKPLPAKVLVERIEECGDIRWMDRNAVHWRWFVYAVDAAGNRSQMFNTKSADFAKREVDHYQRLGVPVEVLKERGA